MKLQYKLEMRRLAGLAWDEEVPESDQQIWKDMLTSFVDLNMISVARCFIPLDAESDSKIRLICVSDAAEHVGGAAVYGGRRLRDWTWLLQNLN